MGRERCVMRLRVLGPLRVDGAGSLPVIRAGQQRTVLALLALEAGRMCPPTA